MFENIPNLITPCCIQTKLHNITNRQLVSTAPLATNIYTLGDITLIDILDWLVTRFPASDMTIVTTSLPTSLANTLQRHLTRHHTPDTHVINHLSLYLPPPSEGTIRTIPDKDLLDLGIDLHQHRQHTIDTLILIKSAKGCATLQGSWPVTPTNPTQSLAVMSYSNSPDIYDHSHRLLAFLK